VNNNINYDFTDFKLTEPGFIYSKPEAKDSIERKEVIKYAEYALNELEFKKLKTAINFLEEAIKHFK